MNIPVELGSQRDLLEHLRGAQLGEERKGSKAQPLLLELVFEALEAVWPRGQCETGCPYLCGKVIPQLLTLADLLVINPKGVPSSALEREKQRKRAWIW